MYMLWPRTRHAVAEPIVAAGYELRPYRVGEERSIGSIATGKAADLVVLAGNPAKNIDDVEKVEIVFKDGVGYDPAKLVRSVEGLMGLR